jgi:transposase
MREVVVDDELWELIQPLLPRRRRRCRYPCRRRLEDRLVLSGIAWQRLPQELGFGSGMTCWRRLRDWQQAGVFERLHQLLLAKLRHERTLSWLHQYRRLRTRYERRADIHEAFLSLACSLICYAQLKNSFC